MLKTINEYFKSFLGLIYPELCIICHNNDREIHDTFCLDCYSKLPFTNQADQTNNDFENHFKGKIEIEQGAALFYFVKQGPIQELIKELKYQNKPHYGIKMGEIIGKTFHQKSRFNNIDIVVPIPLHSIKERKRGYNQSYQIALGISKSMKIPLINYNLLRIKNTDSQTKMNREERIHNLKNAFKIKDTEQFENKHILLVDDVLTTGSTLIECGILLKKIKGVKLSFATIAMGEPV